RRSRARPLTTLLMRSAIAWLVEGEDKLQGAALASTSGGKPGGCSGCLLMAGLPYVIAGASYVTGGLFPVVARPRHITTDLFRVIARLSHVGASIPFVDLITR